ncbi:hypothetical protein HDU76_001892 [Blyttiomyces sp. JEL0837]|nr:hypothetical protein HDU76_001892 [Blyttiomyces sp. JEL0837]
MTKINNQHISTHLVDVDSSRIVSCTDDATVLLLGTRDRDRGRTRGRTRGRGHEAGKEYEDGLVGRNIGELIVRVEVDGDMSGDSVGGETSRMELVKLPILYYDGGVLDDKVLRQQQQASPSSSSSYPYPYPYQYQYHQNPPNHPVLWPSNLPTSPTDVALSSPTTTFGGFLSLPTTLLSLILPVFRSRSSSLLRSQSWIEPSSGLRSPASPVSPGSIYQYPPYTQHGGNNSNGGGSINAAALLPSASGSLVSAADYLLNAAERRIVYVAGWVGLGAVPVWLFKKLREVTIGGGNGVVRKIEGGGSNHGGSNGGESMMSPGRAIQEHHYQPQQSPVFPQRQQYTSPPRYQPVQQQHQQQSQQPTLTLRLNAFGRIQQVYPISKFLGNSTEVMMNRFIMRFIYEHDLIMLFKGLSEATRSGVCEFFVRWDWRGRVEGCDGCVKDVGNSGNNSRGGDVGGGGGDVKKGEGDEGTDNGEGDMKTAVTNLTTGAVDGCGGDGGSVDDTDVAVTALEEEEVESALTEETGGGSVKEGKECLEGDGVSERIDSGTVVGGGNNDGGKETSTNAADDVDDAAGNFYRVSSRRRMSASEPSFPIIMSSSIGDTEDVVVEDVHDEEEDEEAGNASGSDSESGSDSGPNSPLAFRAGRRMLGGIQVQVQVENVDVDGNNVDSRIHSERIVQQDNNSIGNGLNVNRNHGGGSRSTSRSNSRHPSRVGSSIKIEPPSVRLVWTRILARVAPPERKQRRHQQQGQGYYNDDDVNNDDDDQSGRPLICVITPLPTVSGIMPAANWVSDSTLGVFYEGGGEAGGGGGGSGGSKGNIGGSSGVAGSLFYLIDKVWNISGGLVFGTRTRSGGVGKSGSGDSASGGASGLAQGNFYSSLKAGGVPEVGAAHIANAGRDGVDDGGSRWVDMR